MPSKHWRLRTMIPSSKINTCRQAKCRNGNWSCSRELCRAWANVWATTICRAAKLIKTCWTTTISMSSTSVHCLEWVVPCHVWVVRCRAWVVPLKSATLASCEDCALCHAWANFAHQSLSHIATQTITSHSEEQTNAV